MRKTTILIFLALAMAMAIMLVTPAYAAFSWNRVGGDPNQLNTEASVERLSLPKAVKMVVKEAHRSGRCEEVSIKHGTRYAEMLFGQGDVHKDVICSWNITPGPHNAVRVVVEYNGKRYTIDRFVECNNFCWYSEFLPTVIAPTAPIISWDEFSIPMRMQKPVLEYNPQPPSLLYQGMAPPQSSVIQTEILRVNQTVIQPAPSAIATGGSAEATQWQEQQQQQQQQQQQEQQQQQQQDNQ